jgi:hypothetical protein
MRAFCGDSQRVAPYVRIRGSSGTKTTATPAAAQRGEGPYGIERLTEGILIVGLCVYGGPLDLALAKPAGEGVVIDLESCC